MWVRVGVMPSYLNNFVLVFVVLLVLAYILMLLSFMIRVVPILGNGVGTL